MDDFVFFSFCRAVGDLSHFGLSISLSPGLKEVISPSSSDHFSELRSLSSGVQPWSPRGTRSITMLTVATSRDMSKPKMSWLLRAFVISLVLCRAGSAGRFSMVVRTISSCLFYSACVNFVLVALFTASLMCAGVRPALPTLRFFSMERMMSLLCVAWGVQGAEGAGWGWVLMPGPLVLFPFLVGASLKLSMSIPVAVMAALVCLMELLVVVGLGGAVPPLLFVVGGFGLSLRLGGRWRIWIVLGLGLRCCCCCCCCCCWGLGLLLLLLLLLALFLPVSRRFSIALSLSSNVFSTLPMMVSIVAWVMWASRTSCGMPVGLGVLGVEVVVVVVEEEEEEEEEEEGVVL